MTLDFMLSLEGKMVDLVTRAGTRWDGQVLAVDQFLLTLRSGASGRKVHISTGAIESVMIEGEKD